VEKFNEIMGQIGGPRVILGIGAALVVLVAIVLLANQYSKPSMALLYTDLDLAQSGRIVERLRAQNIPFELENSGRTILVPEQVVDEQRVLLAGEGMTGTLGYEIIDESNGIGTTSFVQKINRLRALEGELTRTILVINGIDAARVHLVLPERELFSREERNPSASVVLRTSRQLAQGQVRAIQMFVAGAVPGLQAGQISVVDQNGTLLAAGGEQDPVSGMISRMEERRLAMQTMLRRKIENQLERVIGPGRVRAEVSVDFSMRRVTQSERIIDPTSQIAIASQVDEETLRSSEGQPVVSVGENIPEGGAETGGDNVMSSEDRTTEITNFDVSRTERTEVREPGDIERITAAVLVDGTYETNDAGEDVYVALSPQQLGELERLVQAAIGYNPDRGDVVDVVNLPFQRPEPLPVAEETGLLGVFGDDLREIVEAILIAAVVFVVIFTIVLPLVRRLLESWPQPEPEGLPASAAADAPRLAAPGQSGQTASASELMSKAAAGDQVALAALQGRSGETLPDRPVGIEAEIDVAQIEGRVQESALRKVGEVVQNHPEEAAGIIRNWMYGD